LELREGGEERRGKEGRGEERGVEGRNDPNNVCTCE
jgi:hypothetical protein